VKTRCGEVSERVSDWVYPKAGEGASGSGFINNYPRRLLTRFLIIARTAPKKTTPVAAAPKKVVAKKISKKVTKKTAPKKVSKKVAKKATKKVVKKTH